MQNIIDEYLIKLGATVDQAGLRRFQNALGDASSFVDTSAVRMAKSMVKAQTEIVGGFLAIGGAAVTLIDKVAMADQSFRLFGMHMFMSKNSARALKTAMDALGEPLENLTWDPELRARTRQLIEDQRAMAPGADFDANMRKIRDVRFEFTRMQVELEYLGMNTVNAFMRALGLGPDELLTKLRKFNAWVIKNMPEIADRLAHSFLPIWNDVKAVALATGDALYQAGVLFQNLVGLMSGDTSIVKQTTDLEGMTTALGHVADGFAGVAKLIAHTEQALAHMIKAATLMGARKWGDAWKEMQAGADSLSTKEMMTLMGGGFGLAFGGIPGAAVGGAAANEFGSVLEGTIGDKGPLAAYQAQQMSSGIGFSDLVNAMIHQESGGNPTAVSPKGAIGLMQLMPGTAIDMGATNPYDPIQNVAAGKKYMQQLLSRYRGNLPEALAAYNWGQGNLDKLLAGKATSMPHETSNYVSSILSRLGKSGDVQIGSVTIHVGGTSASPQDIQKAVANGIHDGVQAKTQRNMTEFGSLGYSY